MDQYWAYLGLIVVPSMALGFGDFELSQKIDMELAMLRDLQASPVSIPELQKMDPIVGDYFLITTSGIVPAQRLSEDVDAILTLESGARIYFWKPEDTQ